MFVSFLDGLTGLAMRSNVSDAFVKDPTEHFVVDQSVRAYVDCRPFSYQDRHMLSSVIKSRPP